jgi:hypothetical protein
MTSSDGAFYWQARRLRRLRPLGPGRSAGARGSIRSDGGAELLVEERADLSRDARVQREQQQTDVDAYLDVVARNCDVPRCACAPEAQRVAVPLKRPAMLLSKSLRSGLDQAPGIREPEEVTTMDDDRSHCGGTFVDIRPWPARQRANPQAHMLTDRAYTDGMGPRRWPVTY